MRILCKPISILTAYLARWKEEWRRKMEIDSMSSIDSIGGRFVFNGSHRTIPGLGTGIASPKTSPCLSWPILLLAIFRLVARTREEIANSSRKNLPRVAPRFRARRCLRFRNARFARASFTSCFFLAPLYIIPLSSQSIFFYTYPHYLKLTKYSIRAFGNCFIIMLT